ncbi:MAG: hypothetical protein H7Z14_13740 [Anaerolineae bacterium]|nr:hypothetical protein [Phycisphaerae bacterium]
MGAKTKSPWSVHPSLQYVQNMMTNTIGDDVKACPCQTMVPLYRENVFAQIKPTANTRIDLALFLRGAKPSKSVMPTGGEQKGDRITHRIAIESVDQINGDVRKWMKAAYELAAPKAK